MHLIWILTVASWFPLRPKCQQVIVLASVKCQHVSLWRLMMALSLNVIRWINLLSVRKLTGPEQHSAFLVTHVVFVCFSTFILAADKTLQCSMGWYNKEHKETERACGLCLNEILSSRYTSTQKKHCFLMHLHLLVNHKNYQYTVLCYQPHFDTDHLHLPAWFCETFATLGAKRIKQ